MVFMFYSHPYDVREAEALILSEKVFDCVVDNGVIKQSYLQGNVFLVTRCHLNFDTESELERGQYYFKISLEDFNTGNLVNEFDEGNSILETHCQPQADESIKRLSKCVETENYVLDDSGNQYLIRVLSVVRKTVKNVR